jgi:ATP-dependent RNA helicase DOB1
MDSNDLFSFLNDTPAENSDLDDNPDETVSQPPLKRKASSPQAKSLRRLANEDSLEESENKPGPSVPKKPRTASPKPVVVDEFETEAKREVAASAGLTSGEESGSRLELRHQVAVFVGDLNRAF